MIALLTKAEYQIVTGANYGNAQTDVKFNADVLKVQTLRIKPTLPTPMWELLQSGDPLGPELEAFNDEYIKPLIAYALYAEAVNTSSVAATAAGVRVINEPTSQQANGDLLAGANNKAEADFHRFKIELYNEYKRVYYVFDGVAYPPEPKMKQIWNQGWIGRQYGFMDGRWGWWLGNSYLSPFGNGSNATNANGINIGSIKPSTYWNGN
jgi:hypothetical protein